MLENYMNLNGIWTPVLIITSDTAQTFSDTITDGDIRYSVTPLKTEQADGKYTYYFITRGKERIVLPDEAKQQISNLQSANTALGQQITSLLLSSAQKDTQITQLGQQVIALTLATAKGGTAS